MGVGGKVLHRLARKRGVWRFVPTFAMSEDWEHHKHSGTGFTASGEMRACKIVPTFLTTERHRTSLADGDEL